MSKLVLSSWAFNQYVETPITNEIPHLSVYDLLNKNLKNKWSRELIGMVKTHYTDFDSIKRMHPYLFDENYEGAEYLKTAYDHLKYKSAADANVPGFRVPEYLPKLIKYSNSNINGLAIDWEEIDNIEDEDARNQILYQITPLIGQNKINMDVSGSYETEMDYLMHEVSRYLSKLYPDHLNSLFTLTENERQSYFNEAGHMIHSYFDTYQIQSGDEKIDFYLRNKFLTSIIPIRAYTGVSKQEKLLISLLQQEPDDIQMFNGYTSFVSPEGEQSITSNNVKVSDLATSYNLYKFSYNDDVSVEKTTAQKINGKISESLANFEVGFTATETLEEFQESTSSFIVLNTSNPGKDTVEKGKYIYDDLIKEINEKIEQYTTTGDLPADTTMEQIYSVLAKEPVNTLQSVQDPIYPIFSTSYDIAGEAVVFSVENQNILDVKTLKSLQEKWLTKGATFADLRKTPLLATGKIRFNEQFLLAAGNILATHAASEYKISDDFQSVAKMAMKSNDNIFLESKLSQTGAQISKENIEITIDELENYEKGTPSVVLIKGLDENLLSKNCKVKFVLGEDFFTYEIKDTDIVVVGSTEVVGCIEIKNGTTYLYFGKDSKGKFITESTNIPFTQLKYFVKDPVVTFPLSDNILEDLRDAIVTGGTFNYPAVGIKEDYVALKTYFKFEFDKELITMLWHPDFLLNLEMYANDNLNTIDFRDWEKSLSLDVIAKAISIPDLVNYLSFNITEDTLVSYKIIYVKDPFVTWAKDEDDRYQTAKGYDPAEIELMDFSNRDEVGGESINLSDAMWSGSNLISHPDASISDVLKSQNILELPIVSFDFIGDLLAKYTNYKIVEYVSSELDMNGDPVAKLKTKISVTDDFSFMGEPISLSSLGKLFFEETISDQSLYEILKKDCEFTAKDIIRVKEYLRKDILQIGQTQVMVRDNYGHNYFSFVKDCWENDGYTYFKLKDAFDIENLPNKKGLLIINNEKKYSIIEEQDDEKSKRNIVTRKFYRNGQLVVFDFEWELLDQGAVNYMLNSIKSEPPEVYYKNSSLAKQTKVPDSLSEFENISVLNASPEKYPLIENLIQENKSLYLDSSIKKLSHIPLSYGNLISNDEYGTLSYTFTDGIPAKIDYYNFNKDSYDKLKDMEDFLKDPTKRPYEMEEIERFYQRRYVVWGDVVWDANDTSKTVRNQRTIWSGYFTNFEIYSTEDVLPEEFISRLLSHNQEFSHNILNYNYANNDGKPTGNYNLALTPTVNDASSDTVEVLQNTLLKNDLNKKENVEIVIKENLIVDGVKININVPVENVLSKKTYVLLVDKVVIENFKLKIIYDNDWFEPIWSNDFVVEKSGYTFSSLYNAIFLQETLGNSKLFDPITKDEEIGLVLEWALYNATPSDKVTEKDFDTAVEKVTVDIQDVWNSLKSLRTSGFGGNRKICCIPVLQEDGQLYVHCFSFEEDGDTHIIRKGTFNAYINALMCDSLLNGYKDIPVINPLDYSKIGILSQKFQKFIPTNTFSCKFSNVEVTIPTTIEENGEIINREDILNYEDAESGKTIAENVNINYLPVKATVENLNKLDFDIQDREYSLVFKNRYFKEIYDGTVQFKVDETVEQTTDSNILKCDMQVNSDINFEKDDGYLLLYDIQAPTRRTGYTPDREIKVVDRDFSLQNLRIIAASKDKKTLYLKDNVLDSYNTVNQACIDLKPLDETEYTQAIPRDELVLGKCWGPTTDEIGYSFYKKKFITDGVIKPEESNMVVLPPELVDTNQSYYVNLQDHVGVGDTIEIILHNPPTYRANPNLKYKMVFGVDDDCIGPYNLISESNDGNFNNILVAGSNCLIAIRIVTGDLNNDQAVTTLGVYKNPNCTNYSILEDSVGRKLLFAILHKTSGDVQVGFRLNGEEVNTVNIFEDISSIQPYEKSAGQLVASPSTSEELKNTLVNVHPEYDELGEASVFGSIPIGLSADLTLDTLDRVIYNTDKGYEFSRNPAEMEIVDATGHAGTAMVEDSSEVNFVNYDTGNYTKLQDYVVDSLQKIFGNVDGQLFDIAAAYETVNNLNSESIVAEPPTEDLLACILFENSSTPINITKENTYLPNFEWVDIPYLQNKFDLKIKWKKTPVITGRSSHKIKELGLGGLRTFVELLENSWFRIRNSNRIQSWTVSPNKDMYVIWDQINSTVSVYNSKGVQQFQTSLKLTGYHTSIFDDYDKEIYGDNVRFVETIPVDVGKNIFIKNDAVAYTIGKGIINNEENKCIYTYFEEGGDCYLPDLYEELNTAEHKEAYKQFWEYCKKVDNLAPEVCRFPSFRWGMENQHLHEYKYSYDNIHKIVDNIMDGSIAVGDDVKEKAKRAQNIITKIENMLKGTGDERHFVKGVPFYPFGYDNTVHKNITAYNTRQPSHYHNMIETSKVLVTNETIQIYGEIRYPSLYELRKDLERKYKEEYNNIYGVGGEKSNEAIAQMEADNVDDMINDIIEEIIEEIKTSYSNFFSGNLNEDKDIGPMRKNFMVKIPLVGDDKGVTYAQPLSETLTIKSLTTDGNNLFAIGEDGKYSLGPATGTALGAYKETDGRVDTQDAELFDAVKNAKCVSQDFELINVGNEDVIAAASDWDIITLADSYTSKISEVGSDYIRLYENILPAQVSTEQEITILVENLIKDNHKGFYYLNDQIPGEGNSDEETGVVAWKLLDNIPPAKTLVEVSSKKYAEFATYENASSRTVSTERGYVKPSVFGDYTLTQIDGNKIKYHMYPIYDDIEVGLRKNFYEEKDGQLQYLKNVHDRYIYRITSMRELEGGQPYYDIQKENDHICIDNKVEVYLKTKFETTTPVPVDESEVPEDIKEKWDGTESMEPIEGYDEVVLKPNTLDPRKYYGIKYADGKVYAIKNDGDVDETSLQKIPAIKNNPGMITKYQPYSLTKQLVEGTLLIRDNYLILQSIEDIHLPVSLIPSTDINRVLTKGVVYDKIIDVKSFIEQYLNILSTRPEPNAYTIAIEQLDTLYKISSKSELLDDIQESYRIQGIVGALKDWVEELENVPDRSKITMTWSEELIPYEDCRSSDGNVYLSDVIQQCVDWLNNWLNENDITEDSYYINNLNMRIINTTEKLPVVRPISYFGISNDESGQTLLTKFNNEIIIPQWGYGQRLMGAYTTPKNCVFENGLFFDEEKECIKNQSSQTVSLVQYNTENYKYEVVEENVPYLSHKSFREATLKLNEDLPLKASESDLQMDPVLLDLTNFSKLKNTFSTRVKEKLPNFGSDINTYDLYLTNMKIACKMLYSEAGMDPAREVINLGDDKLKKFETGVLENCIGYTRIYNISNPVPNGILYRDVNDDLVYTNTIYVADPDKYFAFEDGSLGKINKYGEIAKYGTTDYVHAISDASILEKYKQLNNIFTDFKMVDSQCISVFNIDTFLNINHKYLSFGLDKSKFSIEEHEDYKTFLLKEDVNNLQQIYLYNFLKSEDHTFNSGLQESTFYPKIKLDEGRLLVNIEYGTVFKSYNMVYLKDKLGNLVAKVYFRNPIDKDTLMIFTKVN